MSYGVSVVSILENIDLTKHIPKLAHLGELWGVCCEYFGKYWPHKRHPQTCSHRWAMGCLLWVFLENIHLTKDIPKLALIGEPWGVSEYFGLYWLCYNGPSLYIASEVYVDVKVANCFIYCIYRKQRCTVGGQEKKMVSPLHHQSLWHSHTQTRHTEPHLVSDVYITTSCSVGIELCYNLVVIAFHVEQEWV